MTRRELTTADSGTGLMSVSLPKLHRDRLPADLEEAHELILQLRDALIGTEAAPIPSLTATEQAIVGMLVRRQIATPEALSVVLYADRADDPPAPKIFDVLILKIRRKLAPFGIRIETVWGLGWRISPEHRRVLREMMSEQGG